MTTQQQESQPDTSRQLKRGIKHIPWSRVFIVLLAVVLIVIVGLFNLQAAILFAIPLLSLVIALFQWLFPVTNEKHGHALTHSHATQTSQDSPTTPAIQPVIIHVPVTQPLPAQSIPPEKPTFADLAGNLFEAVGKPMPDLGNLAPQNQAVALFNALNTTETPRLVVIDQFENLLDWNTGHALADRPGVGEWLDMLNRQQCRCRILLTSRPRPVGTREYPATCLQEIPVEGLKPDEGVALLHNQGVQGSGEELRLAVSRCSGHAFSLMLLASLLHDHHLSLASLFEDTSLWSGDIATNLLDQIYQERLNYVQRELLLAFSIYREPASLEAAQVIVANVAKGQLVPALRTLRTQQLLEAVGEGRYQLHTIIANYAQSRFDESSEQANEEALRAAHARAAMYYMEQAAKNCPPREQRRKISDMHDLIEAIWQLCQAELWQEAYEVMKREGIFDNLRHWGGNAVLLELCQLLLPLNKWHPDSSQTPYIYSNLGEVCRVLGQIALAREYLERALSICREAGNRKEEGGILNNLGRAHYDLGNKEKAQECYEHALKLSIEVGDRIGEGTTLNYLGRVYDSLGHWDRAQEYYQRALRIYRAIGDREGEGWTLYSLGRIYTAQVPSTAQKQQARKYCEEALTILREVGDRGREGWALTYLGRVCNVLGENEKARGYCEEALSIHREVGDRRGEAWVIYNQGKICLDSREYRLARQYFHQSLLIHQEVGDRWVEASTLNILGWAHLYLDEMKEAQKCYEQALTIRQEVKDRWGEGRTLKNLGGVYGKLGETEKAMKSLSQAVALSREVGDGEGQAKALHNIGELFLQQDRATAFACFLSANRIFEEIQSPYGDETQSEIQKLQKDVDLVAKVEPRTQQIVDQALREMAIISEI